jgi:hypothetical protein
VSSIKFSERSFRVVQNRTPIKCHSAEQRRSFRDLLNRTTNIGKKAIVGRKSAGGEGFLFLRLALAQEQIDAIH